MTQLNLAAVEQGLILAYDFEWAFLLTPMSEGKRVFIKVAGYIVKVKYRIDRYPQRRKRLHTDRSSHFEIQL